MFGTVKGFIHRSQVKGVVVLMHKNVLDINALLTSVKSASGVIKGAFNAANGVAGNIFDTATASLGCSVALRLISATAADGAFYIENFMQGEFFLVSLTLEDIPYHGTINFVCNSWIYNAKKYTTARIFFANKTYLPSKTPPPLIYYRQEELKTLREDGTGKRKEWERIYDYNVYNDVGDPDIKASLARPVIGGSKTLPYPRRGRTGRKPAKKDPKSEKRSDFIYVPRDESFGHLKSSDFLAYILKSVSQKIIPIFTSAVRLQFKQPEFDTFEDVKHPFKFPLPKVIQVNQSGWMSDEEFTRQMIAGVNPHVIKRLQEFPPKSKLDRQLFGDHTSTVTKEHLEPNMDGVTVEQAIRTNKLYILDHHDAFYPYLRKINATDTKAYATRTIIILQNDGTLKPLAIELSSPHPQADSFGPVSDVYLPASEGVEASIWLLAKAYVVVNDSCHHQLISHWLNTHAVVEPFIIATNRHLSVVHPIHKLLLPHYRDTMNINALARNVLVNAEGVIESTFLLGSYSLELSAVVYKDWVFPDQGLPNDLLRRGVAVEDPNSPHGLRLLIEDYPFAADGLEIWAAIKSWVDEYVNFYYKSDLDIVQDSELQAFWKELVEVGHGDLKNATWWYKMQNCSELIEACTTLIWIASALHAAVNFGQYP
ncbi:linoleate 9S-lipoxygenase [Trifolium repens]|nr:linoleate 9S-lipoxygenase [Trifolium repens]